MNFAVATRMEKIIALQMTIAPVVIGKDAVGGDVDLTADQLVGRFVVDKLAVGFEELPKLSGVANVINQKSNREMVGINRVGARFGQDRSAAQQNRNGKQGQSFHAVLQKDSEPGKWRVGATARRYRWQKKKRAGPGR